MPGIWQRMDQLKFSFRTISPLESAGLGKALHMLANLMGILHKIPRFLLIIAIFHMKTFQHIHYLLK